MSSQSAQSSNSAMSRHSARIIAQTSIDAKLHAKFEETGSSFDYLSSVRVNEAGDGVVTDKKPKSDEVVSAYLHQIQKGKFIQPFGCLLALDEATLRVIAYSENSHEMLMTTAHAVPIVGENSAFGIGSDIRTIFTDPSASALQKASRFRDISLLNPILVHCKASGRPFYAIIHRVTASLIIDLEPVKPQELPISSAGALQSYKLAAKAISRLQSLPGGSMERLCDTMVNDVFELTGYDRVMIYKFHEDDHGEVIAEITKLGLEPYLGLHYPAMDVPQAARFLFMKNKVRMICDCRASHVNVVQDEKLPFDLTLCGSSLRAPHSCHLQYMENMNSIASLVMAIVVNENEEEGVSDASHSERQKGLWGLVVCHHTSPRFVPFPLRYACEFLAQVFAIHVNKEVELENQMVEKNVLKTQSLLCDMLCRDAPLSIVTKSPNVMNLVKCDGAVLLYKSKNYKLGITPSDFQMQDIFFWLEERHKDSTGLSTDSLFDAGYPGALALGDAICGMVVVKITDKDWLFWFRSHAESAIRWAGARQNAGEKDDGTKMHPRSSFNAFLEVVKKRSLSWKQYEMDAIHSLQLILRKAFAKSTEKDMQTNVIRTGLNDLQIGGIQELEAITLEMVRLIETASVPIFAVDSNGFVNGWNLKISELTELSVENAIGKHFIELVEDSFSSTVTRMLELALRGQEEQNVEFEIRTFGKKSDSSPVTLIANSCASRDIRDNVVGVCFIAQDITAQKIMMDKFTKIEGDYKNIVQNPNPLIPPIFGTDDFGWCTEWNTAMIRVSGFRKEDVVNKMLLGEIFGTNGTYCRLKNHADYVNLGVMLNAAMSGRDSEKIPFGFFNKNGKFVECFLCVSKNIDGEEAVKGVIFFLQLASHELQQALHIQSLSEQKALKPLKTLTYMRREIKSSLSGIVFSENILEGTELNGTQKSLLRISSHCQKQLNKVLDDTDLDLIIDGYIVLDMLEFNLQDVVKASISQVMKMSKEKGITVINNVSRDLTRDVFLGDSYRLQQVIASFLLTSVTCASNTSQISVSAKMTKDSLGQSVHLARLQLRISHSSGGVSQRLLCEMFGDVETNEEEGISLCISRKLVKMMNGDVQYLREAEGSTFIISLELAIASNTRSS